MTGETAVFRQLAIIPYQELLGNYDCILIAVSSVMIIPYQELLGNYDSTNTITRLSAIIPYQELLGNYDEPCNGAALCHDYTIPRAIREL